MKTPECGSGARCLLCLGVGLAIFVPSQAGAQGMENGAQFPVTNGLPVASGGTNSLQQHIAAMQETAAAPGAELPGALQSGGGTNALAWEIEEPVLVNADQVRAARILTPPLAPEPPLNLLESLVVGAHLLNVNFANSDKAGLAAIGQTSTDYWNAYVFPGYTLGTLQNLLWSDETASPVDITVSNAPGQWGSIFCLDPMYRSYVYPWNSGRVRLTISELPADTYDLYVYATRASEFGAPVAELKRAGVTLWTKGTTSWGSGWYANAWEEHEQYVRFRNIAVNNQVLELEFWTNSSGPASVSGLQIVRSAAMPPSNRRSRNC